MPTPTENAPPLDPNATKPPADSPPSAPPPGQTNADAQAPAEQGTKGLRGAGLRYADDDANVPDWARGKTADEILKAAETYRQAVFTAPVAPPAAPSSSQMPVTTPQQPAAPQMPDSQLMYSDPNEYNRQMFAFNQYQMQQQLQTFAAPVLQQQASFARAEARRAAKVPLVWDKYAHEVEAHMANVPVQARTQEAWEMAAKLVAADHMDEIAQARAETLAARSDTGTVGADGMTPITSRTAADPISQLFAENSPAIAKFKAVGKNASDVIAHAATMGHTPERYAEMLKQNASITHYESGAPKTGLEAQQAAAVAATRTPA